MLSLLVLLVGCGQDPSMSGEDPPYQGPGSAAWAEVDVSCDAAADCLEGEVCLDGVCQVEKCAGPLVESLAPIGKSLTFLQDSELALADTVKYEGAYWVDGYSPSGGGPRVNYEYSWEVGTTSLVDLAFGNFEGERVETLAVAEAGSSQVKLIQGTTVRTLGVGFTPVAVSAGDVDGDGLDELVALSAQAATAVCHVDLGDCDVWEFSDPVTGIDVAVADVDGDSIEEPVLLIGYAGSEYLYGLNADAELTGQVASWWGTTDGTSPLAIGAGDVDGDQVAEVWVLWDDWCWGLCDDTVVRFDATDDGADGTLVKTLEWEVDGTGGAVDLAVADLDHDDLQELVVLEDGAEVVFASASGSSLRLDGSDVLDVSGNPSRIALGDHDGDAPRARLKEGPQACEGDVVPTMLMLLPPYDKDHADGVSSASYGDGTSSSESFSDTVSLGVSVDVGMKASFFGLFGTKLSTKVSSSTSTTTSSSRSIAVGNRTSIKADPELYGPTYGAVVLAYGCFDAYAYEMDDPAGYIGGHGEEFVMVTPTGGGVSLWSTTRYNAMAEAVGGLPVFEIPYEVGTVEGYPAEPERIDGGRLDDADLLFTNPQKVTVSDVGQVGWNLSVSESETNSTSTKFDFGVSAGIDAFGVSIGGGASYGWGEGYSLSAGSNASFSGNLPALPDKASTPEDEYATWAWSVTPYVYLHEYTNGAGDEAAVYVMTYTAER